MSLTSSPVPAFGEQAPIRGAVIGCGSVGSYFMDELEGHTGRQVLPVGHAEVLREHPATDLVAGADPDPGRLEAFGLRWGVKGLYADYLEMLDRERPAFVSIASPPDLHPQQVIDCAERGVRMILCEKPMAPTLREADAMIDACSRHGAALAVNHTLRADPIYREARRLIGAGAIGEVLSATMSWSGRLFLTGTHQFDIVNFLLGDPATAWLIGHIEDPDDRRAAVATQRGIDLGGTAYVVYESGVRAFLNGRDGTSSRRLEVIGREGTLAIDSQDVQLWKTDPASRFRDLVRHPFPQMLRYRAPMLRFVDELIAASAGDSPPTSSGATARHALEQILATHASSADDHGKVRFPFEQPDARAPYRWYAEGGSAAYDAEATEPSGDSAPAATFGDPR